MCSEIFVICNGELQEEGRKTLEQYGQVMVRENKGFDVWAYKTALETYGWDKLQEYDEVIMMNSTIMGPVFPLKETFDKMDARDVDFWGITEYAKQMCDPSGCCKYGYIPTHIQSHFIVCRRSLISSREFQEYWDEMPMIHSYWEAVGKHEMIFTKHFEDLGFVSCHICEDRSDEGVQRLSADDVPGKTVKRAEMSHFQTPDVFP